jgi:predicted RNase H-like HicB family nuclease
MSRVYFPAIVESGSEPGYSVFFPDLPGLASGGDTVQEAALNAEEGLRAHIELMAEEGLDIPKASDLDAVKVDLDIKEVARILVGVDTPATRALRLNVTLPEELVRRIDAASKNRSGFLAQAAELVLSRQHRKVKMSSKAPSVKIRPKHRREKPAKRRKSA